LTKGEKCPKCIFLATSQRYELCSDKCRKGQALQNKREFDKRARENNYDLLYKNECQNWRNKINKAKKTTDFPADGILTKDKLFTQSKRRLAKQDVFRNSFYAWQMSYY